uniref:Uncharacterized protein n=1 Tax=Candidatus Kentrum sp. LFY TaxID=2126342 RepID=A0A450UKC1_9GAMM|nr:MAG: hypothetical protein BECKLFY1418A_GA0070994_102736 [Candidatus Kentron sp. LFY]
MSKRTVASVGYHIPDVDVEDISIKSKASLLDYDVVIFDPSIYHFYGYSYGDYLGKPCLDDHNSFSLGEHIEHWKREILDSIKAGKNVFFMLNKEQEVYVATGEKTYSGTGRNRQTTKHVTSTSNYRIVPGAVKVTNAAGSNMVLVGKDNVLAPYWSALGKISEFRVLLEGDGVKPIVQTKTGEKIVGAHLRYKNADGNLLLLPYVDFERKEYSFQSEEDKQYYWTEEAGTLGKSFLSSILALDKILRSTGELSAKPDWLTQNKYILPKEEEVRNNLIAVESEIERLHQKKDELLHRIEEESFLKRLLYENGKPLEGAIRLSLELMGFTVSQFENDESEFDVVFESSEGRLIGEAEGKDNKAINIGKLRQLEMNIHEDYERDEVQNIAKGALIGNAYRLTEPSEREDFFTDKCLTAANRSGTALIRTIDLFTVARYLSATTNEEFASKCRKTIIETVGVVVFPETPESTEATQIECDSARLR